MEKSLIINDQQQQFHQSDSQIGSSPYLTDYNSSDREMLREAKQLRHHKTKLEQRMKILEEHNKQLEKQLRRSKQLLFREVNQNSFIFFFYSYLIFSLLHYIIIQVVQV
jgi:hypothetical protein